MALIKYERILIAMKGTNMNLELFEKKINYLFEKHNIPSMQLALIKDDQVVLNKAYGYSDLEKKEEATLDTVYAIGSTTKSFISTAIAKLVGEGKLEWDKTIKEYLPWFEMYDDTVTKGLTVRDILCHRSGLPRHDLAGFNRDESMTNKQFVENFRYLEPTKPFRTTLQYSNLMFGLAGFLIEHVTGQFWAEYIRENITNHIGMDKIYFSTSEALTDKNTAKAYILNEKVNEEEKNKTVDYFDFSDSDVIGAAGSIYSNTNSMINWVRFNLNKGFADGENRLVDKEILECHKPQMINRTMLLLGDKNLEFKAYGLGWFVENMNGYKLVHHGGNIDGFSSMSGFIPELNAGFTFNINQGATVLQYTLTYAIFDFLMGKDHFDEWEETVINYIKNIKENEKKQFEVFIEDCVTDTQRPLELEKYVGTYVNEAYSNLELKMVDDTLELQFKGFNSKLKHLCINTFITVSDNKILNQIPLMFETNIRGGITNVNYLIEPSLEKGINFIKVCEV
jgi:CubicO group peptidase (beta-lactamase class C family)